MHVVTECRNRIYGFNNVSSEIPRVRGHEAYPLDTWNFAHGCEQFRKTLFSRRIAVRVHILTKQLNFGVAQIGHLAGFGEHRIRSSAAFFAARERDDAVGAKFVAAFDDSDISAMRISASGEFSFEALVGLAIVEAAYTAVSSFDLNQHLRKISVRCRTANHGNIRRALKDLVAFLLGNAAEDTKLFTLRLKLLVISETLKHRLLGFI